MQWKERLHITFRFLIQSRQMARISSKLENTYPFCHDACPVFPCIYFYRPLRARSRTCRIPSNGVMQPTKSKKPTAAPTIMHTTKRRLSEKMKTCRSRTMANYQSTSIAGKQPSKIYGAWAEGYGHYLSKQKRNGEVKVEVIRQFVSA